jgi:hypothetical protein
MDVSPTLTEPGMKYFINETLKQCHHFKHNYNNTMMNILLGVIFVTCIGIILIIKYKGKITIKEKKAKDREKQHYILSKIKNYHDAKQRYSESLITGLPEWRNEYDEIAVNRINNKY